MRRGRIRQIRYKTPGKTTAQKRRVDEERQRRTGRKATRRTKTTPTRGPHKAGAAAQARSEHGRAHEARQRSTGTASSGAGGDRTGRGQRRSTGQTRTGPHGHHSKARRQSSRAQGKAQGTAEPTGRAQSPQDTTTAQATERQDPSAEAVMCDRPKWPTQTIVVPTIGLHPGWQSDEDGRGEGNLKTRTGIDSPPEKLPCAPRDTIQAKARHRKTTQALSEAELANRNEQA